MQLTKIQNRGQVTLPRSVRKAAGLEPGDAVAVEVVGPGRVEVRVVTRMRLAEALARYHIDEPIDDARDRSDWQDRAANDVIGD